MPQRFGFVPTHDGPYYLASYCDSELQNLRETRDMQSRVIEDLRRQLAEAHGLREAQAADQGQIRIIPALKWMVSGERFKTYDQAVSYAALCGNGRLPTLQELFAEMDPINARPKRERWPMGTYWTSTPYHNWEHPNRSFWTVASDGRTYPCPEEFGPHHLVYILP